jgi:hypothetical protein
VPAIRGAESVRRPVLDRRTLDTIRAVDERKIRAETAAIESAEVTRELVSVAASQETALQLLGKLLSALLERQDRLIAAQMQETRSNRRWRVALFLVAVVSCIAGVAGAVLSLL